MAFRKTGIYRIRKLLSQSPGLSELLKELEESTGGNLIDNILKRHRAGLITPCSIPITFTRATAYAEIRGYPISSEEKPRVSSDKYRN